jgi:hypothetical protein
MYAEIKEKLHTELKSGTRTQLIGLSCLFLLSGEQTNFEEFGQLVFLR